MAKRKALSKTTRFEVFKRDGFTCQYCGAHPPNVILHVDHIEPVSLGGTNDAWNLITSCDGCNFGKGARRLSVVPLPLSQQAEEAAEREDQIRGYSAVMAESRQRIEQEAWAVAQIFIDEVSSQGMRKDWFLSIKTFLGKLSEDECIEAMQIAVARKRTEYSAWKYFCGICWNKIRERGE